MRLMKLQSSGFTLVELMLAMSLFSLVMIIATVGFIGINRTYSRSVIRKQLSESVQTTTSDITSALRTNGPQSSPTSCKSDSSQPGCPANWNAICLSSVRYVWQPSAGLYRDSKECSMPVDTNTALSLLDAGRFKVGFLSVTLASDRLFNVAGSFRTLDDGAFNLANQATDPSSVTCKGSAESSLVRTCAIDNFDFLVNTRGSTN